jgi:hypothetical protein
MSIKVTQPEAYADLGDVWLRDQTARLLQKHLQFGQHFRLDVDLLLTGRARAARAARVIAMPVTDVNMPTDHTRSVTSEGLANHLRSEYRSSLDAAEVVVP